MRPAIRIAFLGLVIAAVVGAPAGVAARHWTPPGPRHHIHATASTARQGGTLRVRAHVRLPWAARDQAPSVTAVVHFASGDVSVDLTGRLRTRRAHRFGGHMWWVPAPAWRGVARVPVAADEQPGRVRVDVTVAFGDGSVTVATVGRIRPARHGHTPPPTTDPEPAPCTDGCQES